MEPIWVLVRELTTLVDSAATSALFNPEIVVVESEAACVVVTALICPAPSEPMTEVICVLVRALTCVLLNEVAVRAPNCVVESCETLPAAIPAVWAVPRVANCVVLSPDTAAELMAPT